MKTERQKIRTVALRRMKEAGRKIVVVTAYDAITARWAEAGGVDVILVGDSLGDTALGHRDTIPVTLENMIHHCAAVARGVEAAGAGPLLVGDLPFMTYKGSIDQAMASCARIVQDGGMESVKLEGGAEIAGTVAALVRAGIPVMGHIGLLPQSVHQHGGYKKQGVDAASAMKLRDDARALEEAGAYAIVLELVEPQLAGEISKSLSIPTIGIGAGPDCDGQVLVMADLLGMSPGKAPGFVKQYADLWKTAGKGLKSYAEDVREGLFPSKND